MVGMSTSNLYTGGDVSENGKVETVFSSGPAANVRKHGTAWVKNLADMHFKYGVNPIVREFDNEKLRAFLQFRIDFLQEELNEMKDAKAAEDVVDALIDLCVVAIGTLDAFDINADLAWDRVHAANMTKSPGIKATRSNVLGLPDLIKPSDFVSPSHVDNCGLLDKLFVKE